MLALSLALASGVTHAQDETATYTMNFEGLWTADDITDAGMPGGAHFTEMIGATHNSGTTIWVSGGTASAGVENVAELGSVGALVSEIGGNANADVIVRAGSSFNTSDSRRFPARSPRIQAIPWSRSCQWSLPRRTGSSVSPT